MFLLAGFQKRYKEDAYNQPAGGGYSEGDTPAFQPIRALVKDAGDRALERAMQSSAPALLARLQADPEDGQMLHEWGLDKGNYAGIAILHNIPVTDFADLALIDGKPNDKLLAALNERNQQGYGTVLDPELPWLKQLRAELMQRAATLAPPHNAFAKMRLGYWFKDHDERIAAHAAKSKPAVRRRPSAALKGKATPSTSPRKRPVKAKPAG